MTIELRADRERRPPAFAGWCANQFVSGVHDGNGKLAWQLALR